jgi:hypothetical protein
MRWYVSAYIGERARVLEMYERLRELGHTVTVDWAAQPLVDAADREAYPDVPQGIAERDLKGVRACDIFLMLADPEDGKAKYAELGAALMRAVESDRREFTSSARSAIKPFSIIIPSSPGYETLMKSWRIWTRIGSSLSRSS